MYLNNQTVVIPRWSLWDSLLVHETLPWQKLVIATLLSSSKTDSIGLFIGYKTFLVLYLSDSVDSTLRCSLYCWSTAFPCSSLYYLVHLFTEVPLGLVISCALRYWWMMQHFLLFSLIPIIYHLLFALITSLWSLSYTIR